MHHLSKLPQIITNPNRTIPLLCLIVLDCHGTVSPSPAPLPMCLCVHLMISHYVKLFSQVPNKSQGIVSPHNIHLSKFVSNVIMISDNLDFWCLQKRSVGIIRAVQTSSHLSVSRTSDDSWVTAKHDTPGNKVSDIATVPILFCCNPT